IGVTVGTLASIADPTVVDTTSTLTVNFYDDVPLESVTEAELVANPKLNLLAVKNPITGDVEYLQFKTATAGVAAAPYRSRFVLTNLLRGRYETISAIAGHSSTDEVVLMSNAVKVIVMSTALIGVSCNYKFLTIGQGPDVIPDTVFTWRGFSLKATPPTSIEGVFDKAEGGLSQEWVDQSARPADANDAYEWVSRSVASGGGSILRGPLTIRPIDAARISNTPPLEAVTTGISPLPGSAYTFVSPGGFDSTYTTAQWASGLRVLVASPSAVNLRASNALEFQVAADFDGITHQLPKTAMGIESTTSDDLAAWIMVDGLTAIPFLASGDRVYAVSPGDRLAVYIHPDGTVAYYINYMGALSDPWFVSPVKLDLSNQY